MTGIREDRLAQGILLVMLGVFVALGTIGWKLAGLLGHERGLTPQPEGPIAEQMLPLPLPEPPAPPAPPLPTPAPVPAQPPALAAPPPARQAAVAPSVPRVRSPTRQVIVLGALEPAMVEQVVERHANELLHCYERQRAKDPGLGAGEVVVKFTITKAGTVSIASIKSTTLRDKTVESCVTGRFLRMQFPEPRGGGIVIASYPLALGF